MYFFTSLYQKHSETWLQNWAMHRTVNFAYHRQKSRAVPRNNGNEVGLHSGWVPVYDRAPCTTTSIYSNTKQRTKTHRQLLQTQGKNKWNSVWNTPLSSGSNFKGEFLCCSLCCVYTLFSYLKNIYSLYSVLSAHSGLHTLECTCS